MSRMQDLQAELARRNTGRHDGATREGSDMVGWRLVCDCGRSFPAERHPVERDQIESPMWYAHVRRERAAARGA